MTSGGRGRGRGQQGEGGEGGGRQQVASCQHPLSLGQLQSGAGADTTSDYDGTILGHVTLPSSASSTWFCGSGTRS